MASTSACHWLLAWARWRSCPTMNCRAWGRLSRMGGYFWTIVRVWWGWAGGSVGCVGGKRRIVPVGMCGGVPGLGALVQDGGGDYLDDCVGLVGWFGGWWCRERGCGRVLRVLLLRLGTAPAVVDAAVGAAWILPLLLCVLLVCNTPVSQAAATVQIPSTLYTSTHVQALSTRSEVHRT